jgi:hypothetical protein
MTVTLIGTPTFLKKTSYFSYPPEERRAKFETLKGRARATAMSRSPYNPSSIRPA